MTPSPDSTLLPLPYHRQIRNYLKTNEPELWRWFESARARENYAEDLRLSLLKSTYRLTPEGHPELYAQLATAAAALELPLDLKLYQTQNGSGQINAAIYFLPDEAHIVLSGPLTSLLTPAEMTSVFGHELAHHALWRRDDGEFLLADRVLDAVTNHPGATAVHHETARRYRLHTEIYADRGALRATQDLATVVAALVKIQTGLSHVSAESYLAQAAEIFSSSDVKTDELSHPECFIRARALALWHEQGPAADTAIHAMIAGRPSMSSLDLVDQPQLTQLTQRFIAQLLRPRWFQSPAILAHARLFFPDFAVAADEDDPALVPDLLATGSLLRDYFAYVLLDFAHADPDLDEVPTAAILQWSETLGIAPQIEQLLVKELGRSPRELTKLKARAATLLAQAEVSV